MRRRRAALLVVLLVAAALLVAEGALARPGGGGLFTPGSSSGSGSGSGSHGSSGGGLGGFVFQIIWYFLPWPVKLLLFLIIIVLYVYAKLKNGKQREWSSSAGVTAAAAPRAPVAPPASLRQRLGSLRGADPAFSLVLFEDFLYALYAQSQYALGQGRLGALSAYLDPAVIAGLGATPRRGVRAVIIGAMRLIDVSGTEPGGLVVRVVVEFEANLAMADGGAETSAYVLERWTLERAAGVRSRPPERATVLDCPGCGAPLGSVMAGTCSHCRQQVSTGRFDWVVRSAQVLKHEARPPLLTGGNDNDGARLATLRDPGAAAALQALGARDAAFSWPAFEQRTALIFREFQAAWSARDLARMRPYLSDNLFQMQGYWVEAYRKQGLRDVSENARIVRLELARVESDASFDAITLRVHAAGQEYVLAEPDGRLVSGSRTAEHAYSEYWTLIRGASRKGAARTDTGCPSCGAPIEVNMAGVCRYCNAKITTGEFDWVLSRIEQDVVYSG